MLIPKFSHWFWPILTTVLFCGTFAISLMNFQERHSRVMYHVNIMTAGKAVYYGCREGMSEAVLLLSDEKGKLKKVPKDLANRLCTDFSVSYMSHAFPGDL
jgi:hypothetical protein